MEQIKLARTTLYCATIASAAVFGESLKLVARGVEHNNGYEILAGAIVIPWCAITAVKSIKLNAEMKKLERK